VSVFNLTMLRKQGVKEKAYASKRRGGTGKIIGPSGLGKTFGRRTTWSGSSRAPWAKRALVEGKATGTKKAHRTTLTGLGEEEKKEKEGEERTVVDRGRK